MNLFNFAASYSGGGFKRLYAYAKWFNQHGGAYFIIHPNASGLMAEFPLNQYVVVRQSSWQRVCNDCNYLVPLIQSIGRPDFYYAYGIPIYRSIGRVNWFHLSNVLPLGMKGIPLPLFDQMKLTYLGRRIRRNYRHADIISAESSFSLSLMKTHHQTTQRIVSVNGSDDEMLYSQTALNEVKAPIAVVVGTYRYKALEDSYRIFDMLHQRTPALKLMIIGDEKKIPSFIKNDKQVILMGVLPQSEVIQHLNKAQYYISTTRIENSYNAASEGIFFAKESYISDIGPHRELLKGVPFREVSIPRIQRAMLHVQHDDLSFDNLKNWDTVINEMLTAIAKSNA